MTPIAYTLEELDTGYYAVNLLSYVTLTTAGGQVKDSLYAGTQLMRWLDGDWRLVQGSEADIEHLVSEGQPQAVAPGTPEFGYLCVFDDLDLKAELGIFSPVSIAESAAFLPERSILSPV